MRDELSRRQRERAAANAALGNSRTPTARSRRFPRGCRHPRRVRDSAKLVLVDWRYPLLMGEERAERPEDEEEDEELGSALFRQALALWINPEIERRKSRGAISDDFVLLAAQIVMTHDDPNVAVRLNEEVRIVVGGPATRALQKGEAVTDHDLSELSQMTLTDADPDAGHITIFRWRDRYFLSFDFRYNASRIREHLRVSAQFLDLAHHSLSKGHSEAMLDNLFSAVELIAKGALLMHMPEAVTSRGHGFVHSAYNAWGRLGNADRRYTSLLNQLGQLRSAARYLRGSLTVSDNDLRETLGTARQMYSELHEQLPKRVRVDRVEP